MQVNAVIAHPQNDSIENNVFALSSCIILFFILLGMVHYRRNVN